MKKLDKFGTDFTKYENWKIYWCIDGQILKDETSEKKEILIVPETQWVIKVHENTLFRVIVTEYTGQRNVCISMMPKNSGLACIQMLLVFITRDVNIDWIVRLHGIIQ